MQTLTLCLIRRYDEDLGPLPYGDNLHCYILLSICQGVDSVVQHEPLIGERAKSPFLGLYREGVLFYNRVRSEDI